VQFGIAQFRHLATYWQKRQHLRSADIVFIPYPAYGDVFFLRLISPFGKYRLIVDAFLDLYDTVVHDRRIATEHSLVARFVALMEQVTLRAADQILVDTPAHREALIARYALRPGAVTVVPVGLDEAVWRPLPRPPLGKTLQVLFWGTFIPLHGVEVIVEAARRLATADETISFQLIGDGQTASEIVALLEQQHLPNLDWQRSMVSTEALQALIKEAHVVLGVFGSTVKAGNVVPYKVHQALACDRPVITRYTEQLAALDCPGVTLVPPGDSEALANAILALRAALLRGEVPATRPCYDQHFGSRVVASALDTALARVQGKA
jgi:glycosyltransferase involved in cell wall biosynthesis